MTTLDARRRFFAEEIEALANLETPGLVAALASVPRERFLRPGPWVVRSETDMFGAPRRTPDDDPGRTYHNYSIVRNSVAICTTPARSVGCTGRAAA